MYNEIWSISSSPSVEWSPATTGRVDADILNGSCDVWGSRNFLPYILYKTASFQKEAMRTQVALYFFYEVKFV